MSLEYLDIPEGERRQFVLPWRATGRLEVWSRSRFDFFFKPWTFITSQLKKKTVNDKESRTWVWERWQLYQPVHSTCIFWSCPPNSHTPITKAKVLPFSSPHASQACIAILVSFLQCPLQPNYFHQVTNGEVGAAEDESRGPSVMCPGRKLKLGRDPATES